MNPWQEGEYFCYAEAEINPEKKYIPCFFIEKKTIEGRRFLIVERARMVTHSYETEDLARIAAISYAQNLVRTKFLE